MRLRRWIVSGCLVSRRASGKFRDPWVWSLKWLVQLFTPTNKTPNVRRWSIMIPETLCTNKTQRIYHWDCRIVLWKRKELFPFPDPDHKHWRRKGWVSSQDEIRGTPRVSDLSFWGSWFWWCGVLLLCGFWVTSYSPHCHDVELKYTVTLTVWTGKKGQWLLVSSYTKD